MYSDPKSSACQNVRKVAKELIEEWVFIGTGPKRRQTRKARTQKLHQKDRKPKKPYCIIYKKAMVNLVCFKT